MDRRGAATAAAFVAFGLLAVAAVAAPTGSEEAAAAATTECPDARASTESPGADADAAEPVAVGPAGDSGPRLDALRGLMREFELQAYIVPTEDEHQSEYVADHDKRREFLSGFTGSQGTAVVTLTAAALWTDSRYHLQAEQELDCHWLLVKQGLPGAPSLEEWLKRELAPGSNVSGDPRTISYRQWSAWEAALGAAQISLLPQDENLVDVVWAAAGGRPPYPDLPLSVHGIKYAGESWQQKLRRARAAAAAAGAGAMVVTGLDEIAWALNLRGSDVPFTPVFRAYLLMGPQSTALYLPPERATAAVLEHLAAGNETVQVRPYDAVWADLPLLGDSSTTVLLPTQHSYSPGVSKAVHLAMAGRVVLSVPSPLLQLKDVKNEVEAAGMRQAHVRDAVALCQLLHELEAGVAAGERWDELAVARRADELRALQRHSRGPSFATIAAFGPNAALPHYHVTNRTNRPVDGSSVLMLDSGGQYLDGTTDVTRTVHLGAPSELQRAVYTSLLRGCIDAASATFPRGLTVDRAEILIRGPLYSLGLNYGHGSTHGIGAFLGVHESFNTTYHAHFFGSQEPGYYKDDDFGIRLENIITVIHTNMSYEETPFLKFDTVTLVPYDRKLIDSTQMSKKEIEWLDNYHERVREEVGAEMQAQGLTDAYEWLLRQTEPLPKPPVS